jgi:ADP-ribose pyrophosphatase YjhB (NUDIX family)
MHDEPRIRPKAICVFRRGDRILVAHGFDRVKAERYARPLGGTIEFGERAEEALQREIREELGAEFREARLLGVLESLFTLEGRPGHEIVFVYDAEFAAPSSYEIPSLTIREPGWEGPATWVSIASYRSGPVPLYPDGLFELLESHGGNGPG